jgi:CRISPR/Cas system-associated endonuclease/helicase Cas3
MEGLPVADSTDFIAHFSILPDPRVERTKKHRLIDILFIAVGAATGAACPSAGVCRYSLNRSTDVLRRSAVMLDARMLYSALVDADFLDTEAHFDPDAAARRQHQADAGAIAPTTALAAILQHIEDIRNNLSASDSIRRIRADLLAACLDAAESPGRLWTLATPTGTGKTLAMLAYALRHVATHDFQRIVVVVPYLSIIEQTARVCRSILGEACVLEHHSLSGTGPKRIHTSQEDFDGDSDAYRVRQVAAENWNAPIVVTTSVQMLESLFSNRPSACRKLHRLARSVVLLDEGQTLPDHLAVPTLATLAWLAERYQTTVVFATATQPAFAHLGSARSPDRGGGATKDDRTRCG